MLRPSKCSAALLATVVALGLAACGDDDDDNGAGYGGAATEQTDTTATETAPAATETTGTETGEREGEAEGGGVKPPSTSPEDRPEGAGDELPARSHAMITGRDGQLTPRVVLVPPFIAIRVELTAADSGSYELEARGRRIAVGGAIDTKSTTFAGLRTGERLTLTGPQGTVVVQASAEPGP